MDAEGDGKGRRERVLHDLRQQVAVEKTTRAAFPLSEMRECGVKALFSGAVD